MLGLNDPHIAHAPTVMGHGVSGHEKADGTYVLSKRPEYIFLGVNHPLGPDEPPRVAPVYPSDFQLLAEPTLRELYQLEVVDTGVLRFTCLRRKR